MTRAFRTWCDIGAELDAYPVLDEDDFSRRECEEVERCWAQMSKRERVELCRERGESIFAARRGSPPDRVHDHLRDTL